MTTICRIMPAPHLSSDQLRALGQALQRWLRGYGARASGPFDFSGIADLLAGEQPKPFCLRASQKFYEFKPQLGDEFAANIPLPIADIIAPIAAEWGMNAKSREVVTSLNSQDIEAIEADFKGSFDQALFESANFESRQLGRS